MPGTITNEKSHLMFRLALYQVIKKKSSHVVSQVKVFKINKVIF